jgi:hypothetical protein
MDNSPLDRGVSLTLSWGGPDGRRRRTVSLGMLLRVGFALALCAACYTAGSWHGALEAQSERPAKREIVSARASVKSVPSADTGTGSSGMAPGQPVGESADVITPLNVRDPSSLVMGPGASSAPAAQPQADEPPTPPARIFPRADKDVKPSNHF